MGFLGDSVVKNHLPSRRHGFNPCVGEIPWRRKWQLTPVLGKSHGQRILGELQSIRSQRARND